MTWDSVPFAVGGGAVHSPEVFRLMAYAATGSAEGIVTPTDLKVTQLPTAGASIRVAPGAALIRNRASGQLWQTYVARNPTIDTVAVPQTGGSARTDLVIARIEDPYLSGENYNTPANPQIGPYIFTRVITNVPAGTKRIQDVAGYAGSSAITLARISMPANTATVTAGMITDLRDIARPREKNFRGLQNAAGGTLVGTNEVIWPTTTDSIEIPEWATNMIGTITIFGVLQGVYNGDGKEAARFRIRIGTALYTITTLITIETTDKQRVTIAIPVALSIPSSLRGTTQSVQVLARRDNLDNKGSFFVSSTAGSQLAVDLTFREIVE
jgi:hypothetical protein